MDKEDDEEEEGEKEQEQKEANKEEEKGEKVEKKKNYVGDKIDLSNSPAPSYSGFGDKDERENMSRMRSAYLQSVVQRQKKY